MYFKPIIAICFMAFLSSAVAAQEDPGINALTNSNAVSSGSNVEQGRQLIQKLEGVYKKRFMNSFVDGEKYQSEDILEFVRVTDTTAYLRLELKFNNGHSCGVAGVTEYTDKGVFVYEISNPLGHCTLTMSVNGDKITFADLDDNCRKPFCGARGYLEGTDFSLSQKRRIRYMPRILNSEPYQRALKTYIEHHPHEQIQK